ncbi:MAG: hypothetical protein K0R50_4492 [Eubacterium sp.]|jgi:predicted enzyme related to lactoylglutathione lyase|nr:hypothetical protein [Eubacterium sp.]
MQNIKYVHTNLIARDWRRLSKFYIEVFGCKPTYPERDLSGEWIDTMTGIKNVSVRGIHLIMPGYENGPTLEIFEYSPAISGEDVPSINVPGFGHLAFHVDDVEEMLKMVISNGGTCLSETVRKEYPELGLLTAVYARDPEGNFIELQNWKK